MQVKVCGMTLPGQLEQLGSMGVTFAGFIFYPESPRYVLKHMTAAQISKENNVKKVGVFVNAGVEEVMHMVNECHLHLVQLHGNEPPGYCERLAGYVQVVKAFRIGQHDNIEQMIQPYRDVCDMFLFDTMGAGYGGTGKKFNWEVLHDVTVNKPFFLSGGIGPGDEGTLKKLAALPAGKDLFSADINSRFEISAGIKDMDKVRAFVQQLNN